MIQDQSTTTANSSLVIHEDNTADDRTEQATSTSTIIKSAQLPTRAEIEALVKVSFKDAPIMHKVAFCESRNKQFDADGKVHRGVVNNKDVGIFQINEKYHLKRSIKMGIDIYTVEGNMKYARILYKESGTQPWSASQPCWGKYNLAYNN